MRKISNSQFITGQHINSFGITPSILKDAILYVYDIIDSIDDKLFEKDAPKIAELLELANLSAVIGNLFREGIAKSSGGRFVANGPHKYPDLLSDDPKYPDIEIKVALETNKPKGHLVKPGPHVTVRYVLQQPNGEFIRGKEHRGNVVGIWEVRVGHLNKSHFNISNTAGDSGKTAVINSSGMEALELAYIDISLCPYSPNGSIYKKLVSHIQSIPD